MPQTELAQKYYTDLDSVLYELYIKVYDCEPLTDTEQQILERLKDASFLDREQQAIIKRIFYVLWRKEKRNKTQSQL